MYHRLKDHAKHLVQRRARVWEAASEVMLRRRRCRRNSALMLALTDRLLYRGEERRLHALRVRHIRNSTWEDVVYNMADVEFLSCFRVTKDDLKRVVDAVGWPSYKTSTSRNQYKTSPTLTTLILLRRLASPSRWTEVVHIFRKHPSHMSEIFREGLHRFCNGRSHILTGPLHAEFVARRAVKYAECIYQKCPSLDRCIGFMDGTVIGIARPGSSAEQNAAYNGHKRKHALKFQTITTPDGLILRPPHPHQTSSRSFCPSC